MAEIVQQFVEQSIRNLSRLETYDLFKSEEIKQILKKQRDFEYRLRKVSKTKDDFLQYILYEQSLLKLIQLRREKSGLDVSYSELIQQLILKFSVYR